MAFTVSISMHGSKAGSSGFNGSPKKRGTVSGWSPAATRRNVDFLRSVEFEKITGFGLAFTGTVSSCPPTAAEWSALRDRFLTQCVNRLGCHALHWVTEWQRRGVPHLHGVFYFDVPDPAIPSLLVKAWLRLTSAYDAQEHAQHIVPIYDALGWAQYTAKHAARGVNHYQRSSLNIPPGWVTGTGRVWGKRGSWPVRPPMKFEIDPVSFYRYRRICRSWRIADARSSGNAKRISSAKRSLACNCPYKSSVRGVSEWLPIDLSSSILLFVGSSSESSKILQVD